MNMLVLTLIHSDLIKENLFQGVNLTTHDTFATSMPVILTGVASKAINIFALKYLNHFNSFKSLLNVQNGV